MTICENISLRFAIKCYFVPVAASDTTNNANQQTTNHHQHHHQHHHIMKRTKMLTYCENLRDVITIQELENGSLIVSSYDKITGKRIFIDGMDDECRSILESHGNTIICP